MLNILETLQNYELPDEVLKEKMLGDSRVHVPMMYNYLDVFFKLSGTSNDTVVECLINDFHSKHNTLCVKDLDTIIAL